MKLAYLFALTLISANWQLGWTQRPPPSFIANCNSIASDEIYYTGICSLRFPYTALGLIGDYINQAPDDWSIDQFIREYLFLGTDEFFRDTYVNETNPNYVALLDGLIAEGLKFADRFLEPKAVTTTLVGEFSEPFYDSGFNVLRNIIRNPFFAAYPESFTCGSGSDIGFCPKTRDILKVTDLSEFTQMTLDSLLRSYTQYISDNYSSPLHIAGKKAFDDLVTRVEAVGTGVVQVVELKAFTRSDFYQAIRDWYLNDTVTTTKYVRKTTEKTTRTTTTRERVIDAKAVDDVVLYLVPSLLAILGMVGAVAIVAIVYQFRPVVINVQPRTIVDGVGGAGKPEVIQMEKVPHAKY